MRRRYDRNRLLRHIDPELQTCLVNVREPLPNEFGRFVRDIQKHAFCAGALDLRVNRARYDIARSEGATRIVSFHKIFAATVTQNSAFAAHCLGNEK